MALRDLLVKFGIEVAGQEKLRDTDRQLKSALDRANEFGKSLSNLGRLFIAGAIARGVKNFVEGMIQQADALKHQSEALGLTTDELQKYQYVAGLMQVPVQQTAVALRFFNRAVGEAAYGTKVATQIFGRLGVAVRGADGEVRPTDQLLFEVADKLKGVHSAAERTALAMRLLGRGGAAMLPVLQNGSAALREMFADVEELGGGFDEAFVEQAHEVDREQKRLLMGWRSLGVLIMKELLPSIKKFTEDGIRNIKALIDWAKKTNGIRTAIMFLKATIVGFLAWWAAMRIAFLAANPEVAALVIGFTALVGVLTFIYNVFDDLYTFFTGGDSLIGRLLDQIGGQGTALQFWKDLTAAIDEVKKVLFDTDDTAQGLRKSLFEALESTLPSIIKFGSEFTIGIIQVIDTAITGVRTLVQLLNFLNPFSKETFGQQLDDLDKTNAAWEARMRALSKVNDAVQNMGAGAPGAGTAPQVPGLGGHIPTADELNPGATTGGARRPISTDTLSSIAIHNEITIHGNADPNDVKKAAAQGTTSALKSAESRNRDTYDSISGGVPLY